MRNGLRALCLGIALAAPRPVSATAFATQNVVVIAIDGLRWQEVFRGAEETLVSERARCVEDVAATKRAYWRPTEEERRAVLLPFFWTVIARQGRSTATPRRGVSPRC